MKKLISSLLALLVIFSLAVPALAAGGTVTYDGNAQKFIFAPGSKQSPTDLFTEFKNVMPGDQLTEKIEINNTGLFNKHIKVYIRAKGAQLQTDEFLSQMKLTVKHEDKDSNLFEAPADETAQLKDWVLLGTIYKGGKITLDVTLTVPIEMKNDWAEQTGYLDWEFKVEEIEENPNKTGDTFPLVFLTGVMVISLAAVMVLLFTVKKRRSNNG